MWTSISKILKTLVFLPLCAAVALFAMANGQDVTVQFWPLPYEMETRLYIIILLSVGLGFLLCTLILLPARWHWKRKAHRAEKRLRKLEADLAKTIPPMPVASEPTINANGPLPMA